jgi:hypothetical protein
VEGVKRDVVITANVFVGGGDKKRRGGMDEHGGRERGEFHNT